MKEREELTEREKEILDFIISFQKEHKYSPTYRDISKGLYLASKNQIQKILQSLEDKGYIRMNYRIARSIVILEGVRV